MLVFTLYAICTFLSIGGGYLPTYFVDKKGMNPYIGRMRAMLIFACFPVLGLFAQPMGAYSPWWPAIIIGLLGAGHQAWSANLYSTIGDMFPKSTIATITGIGAMAGGISSFMINKVRESYSPTLRRRVLRSLSWALKVNLPAICLSSASVQWLIL